MQFAYCTFKLFLINNILIAGLDLMLYWSATLSCEDGICILLLCWWWQGKLAMFCWWKIFLMLILLMWVTWLALIMNFNSLAWVNFDKPTTFFSCGTHYDIILSLTMICFDVWSRKRNLLFYSSWSLSCLLSWEALFRPTTWSSVYVYIRCCVPLSGVMN